MSDVQCRRRDGFSLIEVLLAVGILAVGMLFIAGVFPVSVYFTTVATERTIAPIVADEAFAKFKLYGISNIGTISDAEFAYPSTPTADPNSKQYWWAYLYRNDPSTNDANVVIFVFRKTGASSRYWVRVSDTDATLMWINPPSLLYVSVSASPSGRPDELMINDLVSDDGIDETSFINSGYTIMDDATGRIYRVLERYYASSNVIRLDKDWVGPLPVAPAYGFVWVTSLPVNGGRYPCIGVYQKTIRF
jgi:prepilin-type N-terminal cleavage/methylation domain-containing protein